MPLMMDDIHSASTITVQSGPSTHLPDNTARGPQNLFTLMAKRDNLSSELSALSSVLQSVRMPSVPTLTLHYVVQAIAMF